MEYTAITIGPVYNTIQLTSTPAGLWCASGMLSWIAKEILVALTEDGQLAPEDFVSPFFELCDGSVVLGQPEETCEVMRGKGVGLFHDRIVFCGSHLDRASRAIETAKGRLIDALGYQKNEEMGNWLRDFLRIYALSCDVPEGTSPLLYLGGKLSAMELESNFPTREKNNPLLEWFENISMEQKTWGGANERIKDSFLVPGKDWMFWQKGENSKIRDLTDIASCCGELDQQKKYAQYYAVLNSDGDSMSKCLAVLTEQDEIRTFSRKCLEYCGEASKILLDYGGLPIYAGGDDLLALLPVMGRDQQSIFGLVERLRAAFNEKFDTERKAHKGKPTVSFGISVQYVKSPLFEALDRSRSMLDQAKNGNKNALYLDLQKHSGQSVQLAVEELDKPEAQEIIHELEGLIELIVSNRDAQQTDVLSGVGHTIESFAPLYQAAFESKEDGLLHNLFCNLFDNAEQKKYSAYLERLERLAATLMVHSPKPLEQLKGAARILHFMAEGGKVLEASN